MLSVIIVCYSYMLYVIQLYSCSHIQIYNVKHTYTCIQLYTYVLPFLYIYIYIYIYTIIQLYTYIYMSILRYISLNCSSMFCVMQCSTFSAVMVICLSPKRSFPISVLQHSLSASACSLHFFAAISSSHIFLGQTNSSPLFKYIAAKRWDRTLTAVDFLRTLGAKTTRH